MSETKKKIKFAGRIICPFCNKSIKIEAGDEIITPSEPEEKEKYLIVEKDTQTTL